MVKAKRFQIGKVTFSTINGVTISKSPFGGFVVSFTLPNDKCYTTSSHCWDDEQDCVAAMLSLKKRLTGEIEHTPYCYSIHRGQSYRTNFVRPEVI